MNNADVMTHSNSPTQSSYCGKTLRNLKIFLVAATITFLAHHSRASPLKDVGIDFLILSVRWLPSACISYKSKNPLNTCNLPRDPRVWVLHGLWPQKGNRPGPFNCHPDLEFDVTALQPIRSELEVLWPNIYAGESTMSLWKHEWDKHGTCAVELSPLRDQIHYFNSTLDLFKRYNLNSFLPSLNIYPSNEGVLISDLNFKLKRILGKSPRIKCSNAHRKHYVTEIRMCISKNLDLIDCPDEQEFTNCPLTAPVLYPDDVNVSANALNSYYKREEDIKYYRTLVFALKVIQFMQWVFL